ncbi:MAG TPA: hypothetical protein VN081_01740, partial [Dongiaceae bacterium]|nr:hypothetical protein [Dongiaceae bacterium]
RAKNRRFFTSNNERAFVISQLQNILSTRSLLDNPNGYRALSAHIDLLAFSLTTTGIELLMFSISELSVHRLAAQLLTQLIDYRQTYQTVHFQETLYCKKVQKLCGPHEALARSISLHCLHNDWEYDRYSSIGFYLHDRRGDWMRLWRLARLYHNQPTYYRQLIEDCLRTRSYATSARAIMA